MASLIGFGSSLSSIATFLFFIMSSRKSSFWSAFALTIPTLVHVSKSFFFFSCVVLFSVKINGYLFLLISLHIFLMIFGLEGLV